MDERLAKFERITRQGEIDAVYRQGRRWNARFLRLHILENDREVSRLAISVPRRVCNAVLRNRWKRLIRESFRRNKREIGPGLDIVAVPTRAPGALKRAGVEEVVLQLVRRHRGGRR
jgi:ribonuclease P protein component